MRRSLEDVKRENEEPKARGAATMETKKAMDKERAMETKKAMGTRSLGALSLVLAMSAVPVAAQAAGTIGAYDASMGAPMGAGAPVVVGAGGGYNAPAAVRAAAAVEAPEAPQETVKDDLFAGTERFAKGASDVSEVNIGPETLGMVSGQGASDLAHKMNFVIVHSYTYPHEGMYSLADVDAYRQRLRAGHWNCFVHTYEEKTGESTDVCNRAMPNGAGYEMAVLTVEPKELTFVHLSGRGSMADLANLGNLVNLGGLGQTKAPKAPKPPKPPVPPAAPAAPAGPKP